MYFALTYGAKFPIELFSLLMDQRVTSVGRGPINPDLWL